MIKKNEMIKKLIELKIQPYANLTIDFESQVPVEIIKKLNVLEAPHEYLLFISVCNLKCFFEQDVIVNGKDEIGVVYFSHFFSVEGRLKLKNGLLIIGKTICENKIALECGHEKGKVYLIDEYNDKSVIADSFNEFIWNLSFDEESESSPDLNVEENVAALPNDLAESLRTFKNKLANKSKKREAIKEEIIAGFYKREQLFNAFMAQNRSALEQALKSQQQQAGLVEEREEYALYSALLTELPVEQIKHIANPTRFSVKNSPDNERVYCYEWDDLRIELKQMAADKISAHVAGFKGYVLSRLQANHIPPDKALEQRIMATSLVLGVSIMPGRDRAGRAEEVLGAIAYNAKSLLFFEDCVYDENAELII